MFSLLSRKTTEPSPPPEDKRIKRFAELLEAVNPGQPAISKVKLPYSLNIWKVTPGRVYGNNYELLDTVTISTVSESPILIENWNNADTADIQKVEELYEKHISSFTNLKPIYLIKARIKGLTDTYRLGGGYSDGFGLYDINKTFEQFGKKYLDEYKSYVKFHTEDTLIKSASFFVEVVKDQPTGKGGKPIRYNKRLKKSRKSNKKQSKSRKSKKRN